MNRLIYLFSLFILFSCAKNEFHFRGIKLYHGNELFTGTRSFNNGATKKIIEYKEGLKHGKEQNFYSSGQLMREGFYNNGEPTGKHWTYYKSGAKKKYTEFQGGLHHGDYIEWFESGQVHVYSKFENGVELGHKKWRQNGKIYANYVVKDGKNIGLSGGKLCFSVKDEKDD